jgi:hypothetical protein
MRLRNLTLLGAALMIAGPLAMAADAGAGYGANGDDEMADAAVQASWLCGQGVTNQTITLGGTATLRNLGVAVKFDATGNRNQSDTKVSNDGISFTIGQTVGVPKKKVGGNPWIFFQPKRSNGSTDGLDPVLLGRCKGNSTGSAKIQARIAAGIASLATLGSSGCKNSGTTVNVARRHDQSMKGTIILSNQSTVAGVKTATIDDVDVSDFTLGVSGAEKRGNLDTGVGGNPKISILFWKVNKGSAGNAAPTVSGDAFIDELGATTEVYSVDAATGKKGWHFMGACTDFK